MSLLFYLIFFIGISCCQSETRTPITLNSFYEKWMNRSVIVPFISAYKTLSKNIVGKILSIDPETNSSGVKSLLEYLQCRFENIPKQLRRARDASEQIRTSYAREENSILQKVNNQEKRVSLKEKQVNDAKKKVDDTEKKMKMEEEIERDYQRSADAAQREVNAAEKEMRENDDCRRKRRRKKRLFSVICGMFGGKGTQNAHRRLEMAVHSRHSVQHRLQFHKQNLKNQQFRYNAAVSEHNETVAQLNVLRLKLDQTRSTFQYITKLSKDFKDLEVFITEIWGTSVAFKDQLLNLMDFEHIIEPLNNIYQSMIDNKWIDFGNGKYSMDITPPTSANLQQVREIIQNWDMILIDEKKMRKSCLFVKDD